jgi:phosphotransferase system enzyme I (PtsI)
MTPASLPTVKFLIRAMRMSEARELAAKALAMDSPKEIYAQCDAFYRSRVNVE